MVFVVIARDGDSSAASFASELSPSRASVLFPAGLSKSGWEHDPITPSTSRAVVDGEIVDASDIEGVLTLITGVSSEDVPHIAPHDREYVAAEMTAFLWSFLSGLTCPVLNQPREGSLSGPAWPAERWALLAVGVGVPVWPLHRDSKPRRGGGHTIRGGREIVTVVGDRTVNAKSIELERSAQDLARAAQVDLLTVEFVHTAEAPVVVGVAPCADLADRSVAEAIQGYFWEHST
jgi:hypothetical protein